MHRASTEMRHGYLSGRDHLGKSGTPDQWQRAEYYAQVSQAQNVKGGLDRGGTLKVNRLAKI